MKTIIFAAAVLAAAVPALAQTNVSITVGQPNFYGRIDLGNFGPPPVVYAQPVVIERQVRYVEQPVYLRVPEGHRKHWSKHCRAYGACGQQVYFVQDGWYSNTYAPRYREQQREVVLLDRGDYRREDDRDRRRGRDSEHDHDDERGHGKGHGHGNGKGHGDD